MKVDGVLVIDKPPGLTSHDVVAAVRRILGETRIGHTGTLDPMATGVLPLACGRATRLVRFLSASDKEYEAEIRLGVATDTYDITGRETFRTDKRRSRASVDEALRAFVGESMQAPPPYSAKKIGGRRAYQLARADAAVQPTPVRVRIERLEVFDLRDNCVSLRLLCSAGFYVRSFAHDLGHRLGTGGCLAALKRTGSGTFALADAIPLAEVALDPAAAAARVIPLASLLPHIPSVTLTADGVSRVLVGRDVDPTLVTGRVPSGSSWVRLLSADGKLIAMAEPAAAGASLHPSIVLH